MHSIWQEQMDFLVYPILNEIKSRYFICRSKHSGMRSSNTFQKETGKAVMIIEEKSIANMPELGGWGLESNEYRMNLKISVF